MSTTATTAPSPTAAPEITASQIERYRRDGFVHIPNIITAEEAETFREAALAAAHGRASAAASDVFNQLVDVWRDDETLRRLTLHANLAAAASALAGLPLRLWHDQVLIKKPHNHVATEFHQDQPYWPHDHSTHPISAWIALCDVPVERGCMTFIPGSHRRIDLPRQDLMDDRSLMSICPALQWDERVTVPLRAGDCTLHHGRCAHMATPNTTDEPRVAHVVIFVDEGTTYTGGGHIVTDGLGLKVGQVLPDDRFPPITRGRA